MLENQLEWIHDFMKLSNKIEEYFDRLWPIPRSITGEGYQESLNILSEIVPFKKIDFKSGEKVLDWTIPNEWNVKCAYLVDPDGNKIVDFKENNLSLIGYSEEIRANIS